MKEKTQPKFNIRSSENEDKYKLVYRLHLQKAKILYFNEEIAKKKKLRKNSELMSDFNIFKIRRQNKLKYVK